MAVVTNLGVMKFDEITREMVPAEYYPRIAPEKVVENTGFKRDVSRAVESVTPSDEELRILREEVDLQRLILG